jgi:hypothetical protein
MLRALATWFAKWKYVFNKEVEAGMHTWSARVAKVNAKATRELIVKLKADADALDARIKDVAEMEELGFWLCENGINWGLGNWGLGTTGDWGQTGRSPFSSQACVIGTRSRRVPAPISILQRLSFALCLFDHVSPRFA